jgi:putative colanic acid biosynthesis acetyltransferase WcaF
MRSPIQLGSYDNSWYDPGGSLVKRSLWFFIGQPLLGLSMLPSSNFRVVLLRAFGAKIGQHVTIKPSVTVKYPWHLVVGDETWIGEHVWIDNLTTVTLASNVCVSQGTYFCTGNHDWSDPAFGLRVASIDLQEGAWAGAMCVLTAGTILGRGAVASAGAVVTQNIPDFEIHAGNPACFIKHRVVRSSSNSDSERDMLVVAYGGKR